MITLLDIGLLNCCCYSCDYCIAKSSYANSVNQKMTDGTLRAIYHTNGMTLKPTILLNFIKNHFRPEEAIIQLSGGEPTIHDAFIPLAETLMALNYKVVVNTNGNQLKSLAKSADIDLWKVKWRCSWHIQFRDINAFIADIDCLNKENVLINYVAHPRRIESMEIVKDIEDLANCGWNYEITPFQGLWNEKEWDKNSMVYEQYITAWKKETKTPMMEVNYLSINPNGNIMRCHRVNVGNVYQNQLKERYPQIKQVCGYKDNGNTSCSLVQSLYLLGLIKNEG